MGCDKESLKRLDFFQWHAQPRHISGPQRSIAGVVGTILLVCIVGAYFGNATFRFFTNPPQTSVTENPTLGENHTMVKTCFQLPKLNDPTYWSLLVQIVQLNSTGDKAVPPIDVNYTRIGDDKVCFNTDGVEEKDKLYLQGTCHPGEPCVYAKVKLFQCCNKDHNNPATHDCSKCAPTGKISEIVQTNYFNVKYFTDMGVTELHCAPKFQVSSLYRSTFAVNKTFVNPDLIRSFRQEQHDNLVAEGSGTYSVQYFFEDSVPDKELLELRMELSSHIYITIENRQTVLDLIALVGAFFSVVASTLTFVFQKHNEEKFFELNPKWKCIDEHFRVEEGADAAVTKETSRLLAHASTRPSAVATGTLEASYGGVLT